MICFSCGTDLKRGSNLCCKMRQLSRPQINGLTWIQYTSPSPSTITNQPSPIYSATSPRYSPTSPPYESKK